MLDKPDPLIAKFSFQLQRSSKPVGREGYAFSQNDFLVKEKLYIPKRCGLNVFSLTHNLRDTLNLGMVCLFL